MAMRRNIFLTSAALLLAACQQPVENAAIELKPLLPIMPIQQYTLAEAQTQHISDYHYYAEAAALNEFFGESQQAANRHFIDYISYHFDNRAHIASYQTNHQPAQQAVEPQAPEYQYYAAAEIDYDADLESLFEGESADGALDNDSLGEIRGAAALTQATFSLQEAIGAHNNCNNCASGGNVIDTSSFNGNSGLTNVVMNTGHNVVVQNATTVSITLVGSNPGLPTSTPVSTQSLVQ